MWVPQVANSSGRREVSQVKAGLRIVLCPYRDCRGPQRNAESPLLRGPSERTITLLEWQKFGELPRSNVPLSSTVLESTKAAMCELGIPEDIYCGD